ncbi:hypothetical protein HYW87_00425 [Candidatus Roizmanbacteria bacterium]|nr:hypothetical protein [Candidatus Roizmanbacteria bacterium]
MIATRDAADIILPIGFEPLLQAALETKDSKSGRKVFKNRQVKRRMNGHGALREQSTAEFPMSKKENTKSQMKASGIF